LKCLAKGNSNMAELILKTTQPEKAAAVIKQAIAAKIARIEYSRQQAQKRLDYFEQKYHVTSEQFINEWAAEDLEGKDMEYVEWAGEYHFFWM
jgi:DNA relaxase NicK